LLLLVGELATNAVVHAHSEFEVRVWARAGRVRAEVSDLRPDRALVSHDHHPYTSTGRGLSLVEELTSTHGVQYEPDHHTATLANAPLDVFCDELIIALGAESTEDISMLAVRPESKA
jgi:anti-sigma regulatory factor (Ser/Thr protein kinase)